MSSHSEPLSHRVAHAAGPDRALDAEVALALGWTCDSPETGMWWHPPGSPDEVRVWPPAFTGSVDVAMRTVLDRWSWMVRTTENRKHPLAEVARSYPTNLMHIMEAATPALALLAASLKARGL